MFCLDVWFLLLVYFATETEDMTEPGQIYLILTTFLSRYWSSVEQIYAHKRTTGRHIGAYMEAYIYIRLPIQVLCVH